MVCSRICRLTVLLVVGISFVDGGKNYYSTEHDLLCDVLKAAVGLWQKRENRNDTLRRALAQAIFGAKGRVEDPTDLKLPAVYDNPNFRLEWCGYCEEPDSPYPGASISQDLLCLCTVGGAGAPFNFGAETLCGRKREDLGCAGCHTASSLGGGHGKGWDDEQTGKDQLEKTWTQIVAPCLKNGIRGNLREALEKFKRHLNDNKQLGGRESHCGGYNAASICVNYTNCEAAAGFPMWWKELQEAFAAEDRAATSLEGSESGPPVGRKGAGASVDSGKRSNAGKEHDGEGADQDSATKNGPDTDSQPPIASESSKHSRETSNGGGGNTGYSRLLGTSKLSRLNWFLFSGLL